MQIIRKWVQDIAAGVIAEKEKEWAKPSTEPEAMDGKTEDGLLLCYAWEKKLTGAEDALRRVRLWQKEHDPDALPRDKGSIYLEWAATSFVYWSGGGAFISPPDHTLRDRIRQIALECDAEIKARDHKAAQKALKGAK